MSQNGDIKGVNVAWENNKLNKDMKPWKMQEMDCLGVG